MTNTVFFQARKLFDGVLSMKPHADRPVVEADQIIFHKLGRGTHGEASRFIPAVSVLNFYTIMCGRSINFNSLKEFVRSCEERYLNPHYLRAVVVNPAVIPARYTATTQAYQHHFGVQKIRSSSAAKMRMWVSSLIMSNIVNLIISSNKTKWQNPNTCYPKNRVFCHYMDIIQKKEQRKLPKFANLNKALLDSGIFVPAVAMDAVLFHYPVAFSTLTVSGGEYTEDEVCNQKFPLASLWEVDERNIDIDGEFPETWLPSVIHTAMAKNQCNWSFLLWPTNNLNSWVGHPPYGIAPMKDPTTPGEFDRCICEYELIYYFSTDHFHTTTDETVIYKLFDKRRRSISTANEEEN